VHAIKTHAGLEVWLYPFLSLTLGAGEWSSSRADRFVLGGKVPVNSLNRRLAGTWVGLDDLDWRKTCYTCRELNQDFSLSRLVSIRMSTVRLK